MENYIHFRGTLVEQIGNNSTDSIQPILQLVRMGPKIEGHVVAVRQIGKAVLGEAVISTSFHKSGRD